MKKLNVIAAGLGYGLLERNGLLEMAGLRFVPSPSVFPAVTCVAQASLRTGLGPSGHGVVSNGHWIDELRRPLFWEQSAKTVKGARVWDKRREEGGSVGLFFLQQSLGESADVIVSPAPIHKHGGGMLMSCYTKPSGMSGILDKLLGKFPLWRYWGPFASPKVGRACISWFEEMTNAHDVDEAYLYLPTLDYAAQAKGPESSAAKSALKEFRRQMERISDICAKRGCDLSVTGDYEISSVEEAPLRPNVTLRKHELFRTRTVGGMAYPDFYQSEAFAMCDHEFCVVYGERRDEAAKILLETRDYELPDASLPLPAGCVVLLARQGSWCEYQWWQDNREAPDFAKHVDIHNKPGFDPKELFLFNKGTVKGTHGRQCTVAKSE
jgi:predicted AlkP superfamily pyrophosphatase or phosphodiesterase